uniref:ORF87 n=1 Tax=Malaco herpesvirus 1 TaxID=3031797 RepID=A0AA48P7U0_9VIRU|nr:TPA_asm: ORF87 [Malaco herpesvirus 1]
MANHIPNYFELGLTSSRVIEAFLPLYKGEGAELLKAKMTQKNPSPAMGYFWMTLNNQNFANETKKQLFIEPNVHHGRPLQSWDDAMKMKLPIHQEKYSMAAFVNMIQRKASLYDVTSATSGGTANAKMRYSGSATQNGTYIHDVLGDQIMKNACRVDPSFLANQHMFDHILPGRVWSPNFFPIATTPDGITVGSQEKFLQLMELLAVHDPHKPMSDEIRDLTYGGGAPLYIHEFKTLQTSSGGHKGTGSKIDRNEVVTLYNRYKREVGSGNKVPESFKHDIVSMLFEYLASGKKVCKDDIARGGYKRSAPTEGDGSPKKKRVKINTEKWSFDKGELSNARRGLFSVTNDVAVRSAYDMDRIKQLSGDVVPYLCDHSRFMMTGDDAMSKYYQQEVTANIPCEKTIASDPDWIPAKKVLNREGKCVIIFYEHTRNPINYENAGKFENSDCKKSSDQLVELFSFEIDASPFVLSTNGAFRKQTMSQMATMKHMNNKLQHIFTLILSYNIDKVSMPCVQISWVQNVKHSTVDYYVEHTAYKMAQVDPLYRAAYETYGPEDAFSRNPEGLTMSDYVESVKAMDNEEDAFDLENF